MLNVLIKAPVDMLNTHMCCCIMNCLLGYDRLYFHYSIQRKLCYFTLLFYFNVFNVTSVFGTDHIVNQSI